MSDSPTPTAAQLGQIQTLVDSLASRLQRSVQVDTPAFYAFCSSPQYGEVDNARVFNVLHREPNPEPIPWLVDNGVQDSREPVRLPAHEELDLLPRLCVPLWDGERLCGHIWVIDSPELSDADLKVITSFREPIINHMVARDETFVRRVAEMREITRDVALGLDGSLAQAVDNNFLPRRGTIRVHQLTITEANNAHQEDAPERLMMELLRFRRRRPFLVTDNHDGLTIIERSESLDASQLLFDEFQAAAIAVGARIVSRGTSTMNELSGARNTARRASFMATVAALQGLESLTWEKAGAWRLLLGWELTPATVTALSPAASALLSEGSETLWRTVMEYLDNARNVTATSERLFIHRATLHYRLEKAREMMPANTLDDGWECTCLHAALRLHMALESTS
ncbi:MAG: helix-turn-helix domain-containing protein [Corynebacterium casei]|uniref:helix-turn-helix domain-containing protein n=1 Tax=Corynebacterium casei TaxID=160386 RepID=UPI0009CAA91F|nr:helix-turn-helix domain-containing protein [Corynebacterium casei]SLM89778.1 Regulator of polyketide synthase expression [Corynebacterium casei]HCJ68471.1 PucR family transcriptional regulator [Corynebacterium casei]